MVTRPVPTCDDPQYAPFCSRMNSNQPTPTTLSVKKGKTSSSPKPKGKDQDPEPSPEQIAEAIATLSRIQRCLPEDPTVDDEDLVIQYQITVRAGGAHPYKIEGSQTLHGALSGTLAGAPEEFDAACQMLLLPLRRFVQREVTERLRKSGPPAPGSGFLPVAR